MYKNFLKAAAVYFGMFDTIFEPKQKYRPGKDGAKFKDAHLRAKPLPILKRCKKTGYVING